MFIFVHPSLFQLIYFSLAHGDLPDLGSAACPLWGIPQTAASICQGPRVSLAGSRWAIYCLVFSAVSLSHILCLGGAHSGAECLLINLWTFPVESESVPDSVKFCLETIHAQLISYELLETLFNLNEDVAPASKIGTL